MTQPVRVIGLPSTLVIPSGKAARNLLSRPQAQKSSKSSITDSIPGTFTAGTRQKEWRPRRDATTSPSNLYLKILPPKKPLHRQLTQTAGRCL